MFRRWDTLGVKLDCRVFLICLCPEAAVTILWGWVTWIGIAHTGGTDCPLPLTCMPPGVDGPLKPSGESPSQCAGLHFGRSEGL